MDWIKEILYIAEKREWSIRHLASDLGVSQQYLNDVIKGKRPPSPLLKVKILDRYSYDVTTEMLIELLPEDASSALKNIKKTQMKWLGNKRLKQEDNKEDKDGDKKT